MACFLCFFFVSKKKITDSPVDYGDVNVFWKKLIDFIFGKNGQKIDKIELKNQILFLFYCTKNVQFCTHKTRVCCLDDNRKQKKNWNIFFLFSKFEI